MGYVLTLIGLIVCCSAMAVNTSTVFDEIGVLLMFIIAAVLVGCGIITCTVNAKAKKILKCLEAMKPAGAVTVETVEVKKEESKTEEAPKTEG